MLIFVLFVIKSPDYYSHIWSKFTITDLCQTLGSNALGNINYNHKQNARKVINLFKNDLYFQLLQYNKYLVTISFIHNINYWWLDQGRRYLGWRLLVRNNIFTDIGLGCFYGSHQATMAFNQAFLETKEARNHSNLKNRLVKMLTTCFWKSYFLSPSPPS